MRVNLTVRAAEPGPLLNRNLYGHFAEHLGRCIYEGLWVGEDSPIPNLRGIRSDVVGALRELSLPVLRWPGGCFADEYHWLDGVGPRADRARMINTHWGGVIESNQFGTHEFLDLCEMLGAEPYISANVGSGTVQELSQWVEYMTSDADSPMPNLRRKNGRQAPWKLKYLGIGNENWGCGGNMRAEYYADNFRRYATYAKNYSGNRLYRIACGANSDDYAWTQIVMQSVGRRMSGLSCHYYTVPSGSWAQAKGAATGFGEQEWHTTLARTLHMDALLTRHGAIMDETDPERQIGLVVDEWGTWYDAEPGQNPGFLYQQNTLRDALVAALNLHIFQRHAERVSMANIAQTINVLQAMILTDGERMLRTPSYHVFEMYKVHQGATRLELELETPSYDLDGASIPAISASASRAASGTIHLSLVNTHPTEAAALECDLRGVEPASIVGRLLTAPALDTHNTFLAPDVVKPQPFYGASLTSSGVRVELPAKSVVVLNID